MVVILLATSPRYYKSLKLYSIGTITNGDSSCPYNNYLYLVFLSWNN